MFDAFPAGPEGLHYAPDFVSRVIEAELIRHIQTLPLQPFQFGQLEGKRRVASFGYRYDYSLHRLQSADPIPSWLSAIVTKVQSYGGSTTEVGQILCTEYEPGVGIGWHRDKPQFDKIFGLSLGSACRLRFRQRTDRGWKRFTLSAEPQSLYLIDGPARQTWEHSIPAVEALRYSITFRTMTKSARGANESSGF